MTDPNPVSAQLWPSSRQQAEARRMKREVLLLAAVQMFNERGFSATSLDDVAASISVTKPVIYRFLGSKDQVLLECVTRGLEQLQEAVAGAREVDGRGLDRLKAFLCRYAEISTQDFGRCVHRTGDHELSAESRRQFRALKRDIDQAMRRLIEEGLADGSIEVADVRLAAFTLAGALNWIAHWFNPAGPLSAADVAATVVNTLTLGLSPRTS